MRKDARHISARSADAGVKKIKPVVPDLAKIRSAFLRHETSTPRSKPHTVVVELSLPHPEVKVSAPPKGSGPAARRVVASSGPPTDETRRQVTKARKLIEKIIGQKTEAFFPSSSAFVVSATGDQIRKLANLDLVSAIWPNDLNDHIV